MLIINRETELKNITTVATIGKFDGLHRGHFKIIREVLKEAENGHMRLMASFTNHPGSILSTDFKGVLLSESEKTHILENEGIDFYCELMFDEKLKNTSAEEFFEDFIVNKWHAKVLVVGDDFHFGKNRAGNIGFLTKQCAEKGIKLVVVPREEYLGEPISSSRIKKAMDDGEMEAVTEMLGHNYTIRGIVEKGNQLGRTMGFPTINLYPSNAKYLPRFGVYHSLVEVDGKDYRAITNVGVKPTVTNEQKTVVESHLLDFDGDLYDTFREVRLLRFTRPEVRFNSLEELKEQLAKDKKGFTNL